MRAIDLSHDPKRKSWVSSANAPDGDFPIQNLPFCAFRRARSAEEFRGGVAIGDSVLDLGALHELGVLDGLAAHSLGACAQPFLNALMGLGPEASAALRAGLSAALPIESTLAPRVRPLLIPQAAAGYRGAGRGGVLDGLAAHSLGACAQPFLNALMGLGPEASAALRAGLSAALRIESTLAPRLRPLLIPQEAAEYRVAAQVGDYTDFYASIHHATA